MNGYLHLENRFLLFMVIGYAMEHILYEETGAGSIRDQETCDTALWVTNRPLGFELMAKTARYTLHLPYDTT